MVALKSSYSWKYCPSVCWVILLVAAEALNFPLVSELALLAGSHFHYSLAGGRNREPRPFPWSMLCWVQAQTCCAAFVQAFTKTVLWYWGLTLWVPVFPSHRGLGASMGWEMGGTVAWWCDKFGWPFVSELYGSGVFLASHPDNALHLPLCLTRALGPFLQGATASLPGSWPFSPLC